jgi:TonB-linked SusC/RagA family outer membrane protein
MNFYLLILNGKACRIPPKLLLTMKLTFILMLAAFLQVSAAGYAQTVTLKQTNAPLEQVLKEIKKQTGYKIFYNNNMLKNANPVTTDISGLPLTDALDVIFKNQPLTYTIQDKTIIIKLKEVVVPEKPKATLQASPKDITGQVLTNQKIPLNGATVLIQRTKTGTLTDEKGNFTLKNVYSTDVITVSYIGYKPLAVNVGDKTVFNLVMEETTNSLDQVVVQAYGNTTQRLSTGDIATVSAKEIENQPVMNPLLALEGKVPGLVIQQTSGYASAPVNVQLRGQTQISGTSPNQPLFVIDGVPLTVLENPIGGGNNTSSTGFLQNGLTGPAYGQSPLFSLNPDDIESVSVLKDADATAIYGSRGANGVILITTKKGKAGKTSVDASFYSGLSEVTNHYDMLNTQQYVALRYAAFRNDGITPTSSNAYDLLIWDPNRYTDWQKVLWGSTGHTNDAELAITGGDKQTTFRISGSYHGETPILTTGSDKRSSVQFNLTHKSLDQRVTISFTSNYSYTSSDLISTPSIVTLPPNAPAIYNPDGSLNWNGWDPGYNPFGATLQPYTSNLSFLNSNLSLTYQIIQGLNLTAQLGYSTEHDSQMQLTPIASQDPIYNPTGSSDFGNNNNSNAIFEPQLTYNRTISKGKLDALLGGSIQSVSTNGNAINGSGYENDNLLRSVSNAPIRTATDFNSLYKYAALFTRINYNWEDTYIIDLSGRRDGSSKFGPGKQFGNFGAIGAAWIFTENSWLKNNLAFLSFGKLRGSYGITGSDNIGNYGFLTQWSSNNGQPYISGEPILVPLGHSNPDLQWQVNKELEGSLDLGFLKDRLTIEFTGYQNTCGNQLVEYPLPIITGFSSVEENSPAVIRNSGIESTIKADLISNGELKWSVNFDIGRNWNKLLAFPNLAQSPYSYSLIIGQSVNIARLLHYTGIDPLTGQYTFEDKNHDGIIDPNEGDKNNDLYPLNLSPKFDGGFGTDLKYKNFTLSMFFHFADQLESNIYQSMGEGVGITNYPTAILNHWTQPSQNAQFARLTTQPTESDSYYFAYSDATLSNGSYIRLQNLALAYNLSSRWTKRIGLGACSIYLRGENLLLITKYPGVDPAVPSFGTLPPAKIFTAGLKVNF